MVRYYYSPCTHCKAEQCNVSTSSHVQFHRRPIVRITIVPRSNVCRAVANFYFYFRFQIPVAVAVPQVVVTCGTHERRGNFARRGDSGSRVAGSLVLTGFDGGYRLFPLRSERSRVEDHRPARRIVSYRVRFHHSRRRIGR